MKKSLVALAVLAASAVATAAPDQNTFYAGAKVGWASFHHGLSQFDAKNQGHNNGYGINRNSVTYGVFGGYQILNLNNFGLATELGYDFFGKARGKAQQANGKDHTSRYHSAHGAHLSLKPSYEVIPNLDVYGKVGVALVRNMYKEDDLSSNRVAQGENAVHKYNKTKASLLLGAGVEYAILSNLAARVEYQWLSRAGNLNKAVAKDNKTFNGTYSPDIHSVSAGLTYRFGQGATPVEVAAPQVETKNFAFSSDVLFAFGKANLKSEGKQALDAANTEINNLGLANPAIQVNGYADRIGKDASNLKLSQRRAETVANYLVAKGQNPATMTAVGYGEANPVTGNTCNAVKGRKALIACLAPDRRVEVQVQGSKEVTM